MALFTDGPPSTIADLVKYECSIEDLARDAAMSLDAKLALAAEEIGEEIFGFLLLLCPSQGGYGGAPSEAVRRQIGLSDVVVSEPLRRWHAMKTLATVYRDLMWTDVNDRFRFKWTSYEQLAKQAAQYAFSVGVGLSGTPVSKAALPMVTQGSGIGARIDVTVATAWVDANGNEGCSSDGWQVSLGQGDAISAPVPGPRNAAGWNVYLSTPNVVPQRQNSTPLAIGETYTVPAEVMRSGAAMGSGQSADIVVVDRRMIPRG